MLALIVGCVAQRPVTAPDQSEARIERALPGGVPDRSGWADDLYATFEALKIEPTTEHVCAVIAVAAQESNFRIDPVVPQMGRIAWREIDARAQHAGLPVSMVHRVLQLKSSNGRSYAQRIDAARTEKDLSDIFEDFTGSIPLGQSLFASWNPIRTRGPMQVNVAFAKRFGAQQPYPFPVRHSVEDELFTRRGSLYFGVAHLLAYTAPYDTYLYRFADYNAGQYASRNAAFQQTLSVVSGQALVPDGALLTPQADINVPSNTESALRGIGARWQLSNREIHEALEQEKSESFERTRTYSLVYAAAAQKAGYSAPTALVPRITLQGPKITSHLTTDWYARRVEDRFERCVAR